MEVGLGDGSREGRRLDVEDIEGDRDGLEVGLEVIAGSTKNVGIIVSACVGAEDRTMTSRPSIMLGLSAGGIGTISSLGPRLSPTPVEDVMSIAASVTAAS